MLLALSYSVNLDQSDRLVCLTGRISFGSHRQVGPTIGTCKRFIGLVGRRLVVRLVNDNTIVPCKRPVKRCRFCFSIFRAMKDGTDRQKLTPIDSSAFTILNGLKVYQSQLYRITLGNLSIILFISCSVLHRICIYLSIYFSVIVSWS